MEDNKQLPQLPEEDLFSDLPGLEPESDAARDDYDILAADDTISLPIIDTSDIPDYPFPAADTPSAAPEEDFSSLSIPQLRDEIVPDEHAMALHGMTHPDDPEPEFDMSILDGLDLPEEPVEEESLPVQIYSDAIAQEAPPARPARSREKPVCKGRPKRKKGEGLFGIPHMLATLVWLLLILVIGVTLGRMLWICAAEVLAFGKEDQVVTVTIYESDTIEDITEKLHNAGLIQYPGLFSLYADVAVDEGEIAPGIYDLNTRYDYHALVNFMSPSATPEVVEVMIPEGYTCRQIFQLLEDNRVCTVADLEAYAANGELEEFWFLEGIERGHKYCLEGYLFPDTYEFYKNDTPKSVLTKLLSNFDYRVSEEIRAQLDTLNAHLADLMRRDGRSEEYIAQNSFTMREVVIVASLIEKETANASESPIIASVIYNRLFHWGSTPAYLNIDASIIYALDGKTDLNAEDMKVDSPYNTYYNVGLTPGPIANPGLASLSAALEPADTKYYFYVLNPSLNLHQFSTTLDEHEAWIEEFANMEYGSEE